MTNQLIFAALADPTRRQVFEQLREGERTVVDLARAQAVSRPAVSQHLKILYEAGLVNVRPQGTRRFYAIRQDGLAELRHYLDSFWSDALSAYSTEIGRQSGVKNAGSDKKNN